jgi:hypothetical protein
MLKRGIIQLQYKINKYPTSYIYIYLEDNDKATI